MEKLYRWVNRIKCFLGFHKWLYQRWMVDRGGNTASMRMYVKECKRYPCRKIKKVNTVEGIRKLKTITPKQ